MAGFSSMVIKVAIFLVFVSQYLLNFAAANSHSLTNPTITPLPAKFFPHHHSKRVKISYGPYEAVPSTTDGGMHTFDTLNATKPCSDCLITWIQAGLEYPDGTTANADTGMWLHHVVVYDIEKPSVVCPSYIPERWFASGNERTAVDISANGTRNAGYYLSADSTLLVAPELMNEMPDSRPVIVTITYEYLPHVPHSFSKVTPLWLDVTGVCGDSEYPVPDGEMQFSPAMDPAWTANISGSVLFVGGHVHDGGLDIAITQDSESVCDSVATYGAAPGYISMPMNSTDPMGMNSTNSTMDMGQDLVHISNMSTCYNAGRMEKGEEWGVKANYDLMEHFPMMDGDGMPSPVMGIALLYVAEDEQRIW